MMTTSLTGIAARRPRLSILAVIAGTTIGLGAVLPRAALADPDDPDPALVWALSLLAPDELEDLLDEPQPSQPQANAPEAAAPEAAPAVDGRGRRIQPDEPTVLAFKNVTVEQVYPFIVEATGKAVFVMPDVLSLRISVLNDKKIPRAQALELLFEALLLNGVAVIENEDRITLRSVTEIDRANLPFVGPEQSLKDYSLGTFAEKAYALHHATAQNIAELSKNSIPSYAKMTFDPDSNQIIIMGDVGLLRKFEQRIETLDVAAAAALVTETFHLQFADSEQIAQNIRDLYAQQQGQNRAGGNNNPFANFFNNQGRGGGGGAQPGGRGPGGATTPGGQGGAASSANLRVTSNTQQNAVTVVAEKSVVDQIRSQIQNEWDLKVDTAIAPHVYDLQNSDPVKMRDVLISMFGSPGARQQGGQQAAATTNANRLYGQFTFEAIPDSGRLVVVAKSPAHLAVIDEIIQKLDQPQNAGLPQIIELKHADAEQLAEQLNALLSREGTLAQVTKSESGLSTTQAGQSPFAQTQTNTTTAQQTQQNAANSIYTFWWARSQPPTTTAGSGNLVGKIRIIPVWRQNSLMILSPPEYQGSLREVIQSLDGAGRQVLIAAVIAEISIEDATALGLRWSNTAITPSKQDNAISFGPSSAGNTAGGTVTGVKNDLLPSLFDTSVLNLGVNINALLQALGEKTAINILSEPRIFTSDNQQAEFFQGQDIPFITESQPNTQGNLVQSFDYRAVGINLRVRPRITMNRDVDININLQLASIEPGQTLFGGFIVDRKETTTHLIIRDGQTVVLSGILRTEDNEVKRKVPILGDIPILGIPFNSVERTKTKTELIAFITPYVVGSESEVGRVDEKDRERLAQIRERLAPVDMLDKKDDKKKGVPSPPPGAANQPPGLSSPPITPSGGASPPGGR